jgi:hypothetical protein
VVHAETLRFEQLADVGSLLLERLHSSPRALIAWQVAALFVMPPWSTFTNRPAIARRCFTG